MKKVYVIDIEGCDDHTTFKMELDEREKEVILNLCRLSQKTSRYSCQPKIELYNFNDFNTEDFDEESSEEDNLRVNIPYEKSMK